MKRSFKGFAILAFVATALTAYSQETPSFLEPIDPIGFNEKKIHELLRSAQLDTNPARVEIGSTILWVYWRNIDGHHILKMRKDKLYQRDLPPNPDPFVAPDVPYDEVFTLAFSKVVVQDIHQLEGLVVKTTQTSIPPEVAGRLVAVWDALTLKLQYRVGYPGGRGYRYESHFFIAGLQGPAFGRRLGGVHAPKDGPLFDFANLAVKLHQLVEPVPAMVEPSEGLQREIITACTLLEEKLKKR